MHIHCGEESYDWTDNWANMPNAQSAGEGWAHNGVAITESGDIVTFHPAEPTMLVFDQAGNLRRSWDTDLTEAHGITLVKEGESEYLWIADNGRKRAPQVGYEYPPGGKGPRVIKMTMHGETVMSLQVPELPVYRDAMYSPTFVTINEERLGGNGDIWVTDGYGQSYVHRYDRRGNYVSSLSGEEGDGGRFNCPHAIYVDRRRSEPELYVADRGNSQVQVYDLEGGFKRAFGTDFLTTPSGFATHGDRMIVAELRARVTVLDENDSLVCYLGENEAVCGVDGWPNNKNDRGDTIRTKLLSSGRFNSPHGMAVDRDGNIYIAEWMIGGRQIKLVRS